MTRLDCCDYLKISTFVNVLLLGALIVALAVGCEDEAWAEVYSSEDIADAIWIVEGKERAKKPFGILSVPCNGYQDCRNVCLNTIENNFSRFQVYGYKTHSDFLSFLADRYCPVGAENDNGSNKFWLKNLRYYLGQR